MRTAAALLATAVLAAATPVRAQEQGHAAARQRFTQGEAHFAARRYAEALQEYEAGYAAAPLPGFLINIGQCHRRLGDLPKARAAFQKFVLVAPDSPRRPEVEAVLAEIDAIVATLERGERRPDLAEPPSASPSAAPSAGARPSRWWLWAGAAAVAVAGGTAAALALSSSSSPRAPIEDGTIGTLRR